VNEPGAVVRKVLAARPELGLEAGELARYLSERQDGDGALHAADLALACGCALGRRAALAAFDRELGPEIDRVARRFASSGLDIDEGVQLVRVRLLVGTGGAPPRIAAYGGRGSLRGFVRAAAARTLVDELRAARRRPDHPGADQVLADLAADGDDPEIEHLKHRYRDAFRCAFEEAVAALEPAQRTALRYHYLHGLTIDELGTLYKVHRATAARRLAAARDALLKATRRRLTRALGVDRREVDSIMRLIESRLEVSMSRLLETVPPALAAQSA
jgi:RNA polymerase sigma-70 factor, ECF subfamily